MPELTNQDRLQPALLDRLTDSEPGALSEARSARVVSRTQLRQSVLRDLTWLLNSPQPPGSIDEARWSYAAESVLNYGLPNLSGQSISTLDPAQLAHDIADAIRRFEPRILPDSLRVSPRLAAGDTQRPLLLFQIEGTLWAQPYPEQLYYHAELDLEDSVIHLSETSGRH